jgi:uncharacterized protein (TIGR02271 family)
MHNERLVPLHSLPDFHVAGGYTDIRGFDAFLPDGRPAGRVRELLVDPDGKRVEAVTLDLPSGASAGARGAGQQVPIEDVEIDTPARRVLIGGAGAERLAGPAGGHAATAPAAALMDDDATLIHPAAQAGELDRPELARAGAGQADQRLTLSEEELALHKERVSAGEVQVQKHVETRHVRESVPVMREEVTVERRAVTEPNASTEIRYEGDTMYVPIVEEELVVQKRTVVREELVIRRKQVQTEQVVEADLRRERAEVSEHGDVREVGGGMHAGPSDEVRPSGGQDDTRYQGSGGGLDGIRVR